MSDQRRWLRLWMEDSYIDVSPTEYNKVKEACQRYAQTGKNEFIEVVSDSGCYTGLFISRISTISVGDEDSFREGIELESLQVKIARDVRLSILGPD